MFCICQRIHLERKIIISLLLVILFTNATSQKIKPVLTLPIGHQRGVNTIDFSKDGQLIVTGSLDNTFILWDAKTGFIIRRIKTESPVLQVLFTPDGSQIITVNGQEGAKSASAQQPFVYKWDVKTGKQLMQFPFTASPGIQFLPSGYLVVPDYSDDISRKDQNAFQGFYDKMIKAGQMADEEDDEENQDSIDAVNDKYAEEVEKSMGKVDFSDPKKLEAYQRQMTEKIMEGMGIPGNSIALIDAKTLKPVAAIKVAAHTKFISYNSKEYFLAEKNYNYINPDEGKNLELFGISEIIKQYQEKKTITPLKEFSTGNKNSMDMLAVSSVKGFFANDFSGNTFQLWQTDKTKPLTLFKAKGMELSSIEFSPDATIVYAYSTTPPVRYIEGWNTTDYKQIVSAPLPEHYTGVHTRLSNTGDYFLADAGFGLIKLSLSGDSLTQFHGQWAIPSEYGFVKNDKEVSVSYNAMMDLYSMMKSALALQVDQEEMEQKKKWTASQKEKMVQDKMNLMPMGQKESLYKGYTLNWDLIHGGAYYAQEGMAAANQKKISENKNYLLANEQYEFASKDQLKQTSKLVNVATTTKAEEDETEEDKLDRKGAEMLSKSFAAGGAMSKMLNGNVNGPVTLLINQKTKDTISMMKIDSTDWVMLLKNGYYMSSKNGAKSLSYTRGFEVFPFEQFDIKYNRPDLVLKAIGMADPVLINAYRNAYQKRIKKLDIDTTQFKDEFEVPEAGFANKEKILREQKTNKLSLNIVASDNKSKLDRFNIWVNEVPVYGKKGKSLKESGSGKLNTTVEIILSQGMNRIETSVINANGIESYRVPLLVKYTPDVTVKEIVHFIGIGIDQFADSKYNLKYSSKDIRDLSKKLKEKYKDNIIIDTLFNENVTTNNVKALKQKLLSTTENDKVIISYSGHGMLSKDFDYYLSTYTVNFENPEQNGLPYDELENLLDGIPARKKLLLIDACHSGEVDKEDLVRLNATPDSLIKGLKPIAYKKDGQLGLTNAFELMQSLFVNVGKSTGATIISAAAGTQFALERNDLKNGVFTFSIIEAMNKYPTLKISELKKIVGNRVEQITKGLQKPTSRNETIAVDWSVW